MTSSISTAAVVSLLLCSTAQAQHFTDVTQQLDANERLNAPAADRRAPVRIQVNYQLQLPVERLGSAETVEQRKATLTASHEALYQLAARECEQLTRSFPGDCRMASLNINMGQPSPFNASPLTTASASAIFDLVPTPPPGQGAISKP